MRLPPVELAEAAPTETSCRSSGLAGRNHPGSARGCRSTSVAGWADPTATRRNNFDVLRFALASAVILSHSFALLAAPEPFDHATRGQINLGAFAVDAFFIISGFLITHSWIRGSDRRGAVLDFYKKRILRIYPAYVAAVAVCAFIVFPLATTQTANVIDGHELRRVATSALTLRPYGRPGAFPDNHIHALNGSLWSISYEFWCYVGISLIGILGLLRWPRVLLGLFVATIVVSVLFVLLDLRPGGKILGTIFGSPRLWARMLPYYLSGAVFYLFRHHIPYSPVLALTCAAITVACAKLPNAMHVAVPTCGAYLLFWIAFHPSIRLENWAKWGDFSYGMYLYAFPIQQLLIHFYGQTYWSPLTLFLSSMISAVVAGIISWMAVERWFLQFARQTRSPELTAARATPEAEPRPHEAHACIHGTRL